MRRAVLAVALVIASLALLAPPAQAHGTCTPGAGFSHTSSTVNPSGNFSCGSNRHYVTYITVSAVRRTPGGAWNTYWSETVYYFGTNLVGHSYTLSGYNCAKDYKTFVQGWTQNESGTVAHKSSTNSAISFHTC